MHNCHRCKTEEKRLGLVDLISGLSNTKWIALSFFIRYLYFPLKKSWRRGIQSTDHHLYSIPCVAEKSVGRCFFGFRHSLVQLYGFILVCRNLYRSRPCAPPSLLAGRNSTDELVYSSPRPARRRWKGIQPVGHYPHSRAVRDSNECRDASLWRCLRKTARRAGERNGKS